MDAVYSWSLIIQKIAFIIVSANEYLILLKSNLNSMFGKASIHYTLLFSLSFQWYKLNVCSFHRSNVSDEFVANKISHNSIQLFANGKKLLKSYSKFIQCYFSTIFWCRKVFFCSHILSQFYVLITFAYLAELCEFRPNSFILLNLSLELHTIVN